jgi:hypothetical protein
VGCAPDGPAKCLWVLGRYTLETFLRSACLEWLYQTPCSYVGYLGVSTLRTFKDQHRFSSFIVDFEDNGRPLHTMCLSKSHWVSSDTGHHRLEASLRSACLQCLLEVGPARFLAAMLGDLGASTLRLIKTMTQFSSLFLA